MHALSRSLVLIALVAGPASAGDAPVHVINDSEATTTIACAANDDVVVNGGENRLTLTGECGKVMVNGGDNTLAIEAAAKIVVSGAGNKVTYKRGVGGSAAPKTSNLGKGNSIAKAPAGK
jgi:hypothetical protein